MTKKLSQNELTSRAAHPLAGGFTLIELMIVLALVAIASALVLPAIGHAFGNLELRTAASSMSSLCAQARTHSVYEGRSYQIVFGPAEESARQLFLLRDDGHQIQHITLPAHIAVLAGGADGGWNAEVQPVHFFPDGTSELAQLDLRDPRKKHVLLVLDPLTARARVTQINDEAEQ